VLGGNRVIGDGKHAAATLSATKVPNRTETPEAERYAHWYAHYLHRWSDIDCDAA